MSPQELLRSLQQAKVDEDHAQTVLLLYLSLPEPPANPLAWARQKARWLTLDAHKQRVGRVRVKGKRVLGERTFVPLHESWPQLSHPNETVEPEQLRRMEARQELEWACRESRICRNW